MSSDKDIPAVMYDNKKKIAYRKGRFFGKGGYAKCYEAIRESDKKTFAAKVMSKKLLTKQIQKEKMTQEIQIHAKLNHPNIVEFFGFFEDPNNIYIVLELCKKRSMMELSKRRQVITEPETRYYMSQIVSGVNYLHSNRIIHRDLKLGNLFLNDNLQVKIGDFGLAAKIEFDGERKRTMCGTPNYIAPEILSKKGHSFEVDIWSLGCIMYTLMVGRPPFETPSLKETYAKIANCNYTFTIALSPAAKHLIMIMLQSDPSKRPKINTLNVHEFFKGYCPSSLPVSCLAMAPRFDKLKVQSPCPQGQKTALKEVQGQPKAVPDSISYSFKSADSLRDISNLISKLVRSNPRQLESMADEMTDPAAQPTIWVSKWVDYSDKYGFGYQLSDDTVGVMFNDTTRLMIISNGKNMQYVDQEGCEECMTIDAFPKALEKKVRLLTYFNRYMREHLVKTGAQVCKEYNPLSRQPHLHQWCRSEGSVVMQLSNGTLQVNFGDHTKVIICPLMEAVTYVDGDPLFLTFRFATLMKQGCLSILYEKLRYIYQKIAVLLERED